MSASKDNKNQASAGDPENRRKRGKTKLIQLDDLIPKGNVVGGRQLLFGASYTTQGKSTNHKPKHQN